MMFNNEGVNIVEAISELTSWKFCAASEAPLCLESRLWRQARRGSYDRKSQPRTSDRIRGGKAPPSSPSPPHGLLAFTQQLTPSKSPQTVCRVRKVRQLQVQANEGNVVLEVPNPPHFFPVAHFLFLFFEVYISPSALVEAHMSFAKANPSSREPSASKGSQIARITPAAIVHCGNPGHKPSAGQRRRLAKPDILAFPTPHSHHFSASSPQLPFSSQPRWSAQPSNPPRTTSRIPHSSPCLGCEAPPVPPAGASGQFYPDGLQTRGALTTTSGVDGEFFCSSSK
ncbi:hypothetical protein B0H13DRAFT_2438000 [Mycena leptocephala]|nr:hypothetical protein B0H13DRAFT_2438000 [Mycena leptocephala]